MLFISIFLSPFIFINHVLLCNFFYNLEKKIFFMFINFIIYFMIFLLIIIYYDYFKLNLEFFSSISIIIFFCLGYMEFFSMVCRGFSLRILTDIYKYKGTNKKNIINRYADNKGIDWLFKKRLKSIEKLNLINFVDDKIYINTSRGIIVAYITFYLNKLFLIKSSGE